MSLARPSQSTSAPFPHLGHHKRASPQARPPHLEIQTCGARRGGSRGTHLDRPHLAIARNGKISLVACGGNFTPFGG